MNHHAYYVEGPLFQFEDYKLALKPFWARQFERFGVEESRELILLTGLKNVADSIFLIGAATITSEAQQALLKLFEEPQLGTTFIVLIPHGSLISTLRSRMLPYPKKIDVTERSSAAVKKFLSESYTLRSATIAALLKDEEGVRERIRDFLDGLEQELYVQLQKAKVKNTVRAELEDIAKVRSYLSDRSPSLKMLLEHLAATLSMFGK
ncbi:MAG: hypothetical protein Q7R71_00540 [bacterium]|nr:hypothetical protein [bacterium]